MASKSISAIWPLQCLGRDSGSLRRAPRSLFGVRLGCSGRLDRNSRFCWSLRRQVQRTRSCCATVGLRNLNRFGGRFGCGNAPERKTSRKQSEARANREAQLEKAGLYLDLDKIFHSRKTMTDRFTQRQCDFGRRTKNSAFLLVFP